MVKQETKVFIGTWVSKKTRVDLKIACAKLDLTQGDVIGLLIENWVNKNHVKNG
tara:strand:+ start:51 stop:212 length:162 start_codon:yes stop_codon:yes gene_type:complete